MIKQLSIIVVLFFCFQLNGQQEELAKENKRFSLGMAIGISGFIENTDPNYQSSSLLLSLPNFKLAWRVSPQTQIGLYLPGTLYQHEGEGRTRDRGFEGIYPFIQFYPSGKFWIASGYGIAMNAPAFYDIKEESERTFDFGHGMVLMVGKPYKIHSKIQGDIQLRIQTGSFQSANNFNYGETISFLIGLNLCNETNN